MVEPVMRPKRIGLRVSQGTMYDEAKATGIVKPGHLCQPGAANADGDETITFHSVEGGRGALFVAHEDAYQGKTINDAYAVDDIVFHTKAIPGDRYFLLLAAGEDASDGDVLSSNGNGELKVAAEGEEVIAIAREDMDLLASDAVSTHMIVEILPQAQVPVSS